MRLLITSNSKTRLVRDGHSFDDTCAACGRPATFEEVEHTEGVGLFWVDVVTDTTRHYRCSRCGELFDVPEDGVVPAKSAAALAKEQAAAAEASRRQAAAAAEAARIRAAADRARAETKAIRIEDELAELKRRAGK